MRHYSQGPRPGAYQVCERSALRRPPRWHHLSYIARALPAALERLAREAEPDRGGRILDFGCADQPYRGLFAPECDFVGADLPGNPLADLEIRPDGTVAAADESFDLVLSTQVLEHVDDPATYLSESFRLLRPGGRLLLSTHGMMIYHPDPVDLWRWTGEGLRRVVADAGFAIVHFEGVMGMGATGVQFLQDAILRRLPRLLRPPLALLMQTVAELVDRLDDSESRALNALVFALVAEKQ